MALLGGLNREQGMRHKFGKLLKKYRLATGATLREFCQANAIDPGNHSRMERGLFPPPQSHEILEKYALALQLKPGSDEWLELFDTAAAVRGEIPKDLMGDEGLVEKLPVLFRTMRAKQIGPDQLDELIDKIRRS